MVPFWQQSSFLFFFTKTLCRKWLLSYGFCCFLSSPVVLLIMDPKGFVEMLLLFLEAKGLGIVTAPFLDESKRPEIVVRRKDSEIEQDMVKVETYGTSGCVELFVEALKENEIEYNKKTIYGVAGTTRKIRNKVQLPEVMVQKRIHQLRTLLRYAIHCLNTHLWT